MTKDREPMTGVDAAWLHMEQDKNFMMIGGLMILDRPIDLDRFRDIVEKRFLKFSRFRQRVVESTERIWWELDPGFHLDNHVHHVALPAPGDRAELQRLISDLISTPLDFRRPLWQVHVVDRGESGSAVFFRIHHCIADGLALVQVVLSMTDEERNPPDSDTQTQPGPRKPNQSLLGTGIRLGRKLAVDSLSLLAQPKRLVGLAARAFDVGRELAHLGLMPADPAGLLKGQISGRKNVAWAEELDLARVKDTAHALSGTVNDVLLASAIGALRQYLLEQGKELPSAIHAAIPFNLRPMNELIETLGNQFGMAIVALPIGLDLPLERYKAVQKTMEVTKHSSQPIATYGLLNALGYVPAGLEHRALNILSKKASMVMTNVPGPTRTLYLAGAQVIRPMAWVPQSGDIGVGLSILSYAGTVQFGILADQSLILHVDKVAAYFPAQFEALAALAQTRANQPHPRQR